MQTQPHVTKAAGSRVPTANDRQFPVVFQINRAGSFVFHPCDIQRETVPRRKRIVETKVEGAQLVDHLTSLLLAFFLFIVGVSIALGIVPRVEAGADLPALLALEQRAFRGDRLSARQFRHPHFVDEVLGVLEETGANPQRLKLELTETLLLDDVEDTIERMTTLRALGLGFSLDDFGTGYSSLSYLKRLPLDQLKIDQSFVRDLLTDANDASIARTIVTLAQSLDLGVIAEGVETCEQRDMLISLGCLTWQGYLFGRPGPAAELRAAAAVHAVVVP